MPRSSYYFTTRDLLLMAALAALGGITSTAINAMSDVVQSVLGFAGGSQWAAGLHVLWLTLAAGLIGKPGAGTVAGLLKGGVEFLTGNTHGVLVVLVDLVAGVLVDLGVLPFRRKDRALPLIIGGGLASASNVFVFQLFASLPADVLAYGTLILLGLVAGASGMLFAGVLGFGLLSSLQRAGVVKSQTPAPITRNARLLFVALSVIVVVGLSAYLRVGLAGPASISVTGEVANPFTYPDELNSLDEVTRQADRQGVAVTYTGVPLAAVIDHAHPDPDASKVLILASDGYGFFLSMQELEENRSILLASREVNKATSFDVVGPRSSKAWVRGVEHLVVIGGDTLPLLGVLESPGKFDPDGWQDAMDSVTLNLSSGQLKAQGVPLGDVLDTCGVAVDASRVVVVTAEGALVLGLDEVWDEDLRVFSVIQEDGISFALGKMDGEVLAEGLVRIEVR